MVPSGGAWYQMEIGRQGVKPAFGSLGGVDEFLMAQNVCWISVWVTEELSK